MGIDKPNHIDQLINLADDRVRATLGRSLTDIDKIILEQALTGKRLKDIQVVGYSPATVERVFAPRLWTLLSDATQQKVRIKSVRLILEALAVQTQPVSVPAIAPSSEHSPDPAIDRAPLPRPAILENLPAPTYTSFIGREAEINQLLQFLAPDHSAHLISIAGIGGVGKTSLALECARRCLAASRQALSVPTGAAPTAVAPTGAAPAIPTFDGLIFVSAKLFYLESFGLLERFDPARSLQDILWQIAEVLGEGNLAGASIAEQVSILKRALRTTSSSMPTSRRMLLIIDNLETMENQQAVLSFLYDLPASVKVLITTREQVVFVPVRLMALAEPDGLSLIAHESQEKGVVLSTEAHRSLYQATGGVPVAIRYAVGQLANGYSIDRVLRGIAQPTGDVAQFCFENTVQGLRRQPAHELLMALALFPAPVLRDTLFQVATPTAVATPAANLAEQSDALAQLCRLSLVNQEERRYGMLPLTQEYALAELRAYPEFAQAARRRWVDWAIRCSEAYHRTDIQTWQGSIDGLQVEWQNLRSIADYCMAEGWYTELLQLWQNLESYTYHQGRRKGRKDYWGDRLRWTAWLIPQATERGDWAVAAQVMGDRAWTLTAIRKPDSLAEAEALFEQAWELSQSQPVSFQMEMAKRMAVLQIQHQQFEEAEDWLERAEHLWQQAELEEPDRSQQWVQLRYYRGMKAFKAEQMDQSQCYFAEARDRALALGWERAVRMAENWLADIAVAQGELEVAEHLLVRGLEAAENQNDPTRMAYVQWSFAELVRSRGNWVEATRWALEALELFDRLGMTYEAEEVQALLSRLNSRPEMTE